MNYNYKCRVCGKEIIYSYEPCNAPCSLACQMKETMDKMTPQEFHKELEEVFKRFDPSMEVHLVTSKET